MRKQCDEDGYNDDPNDWIDTQNADINNGEWIFALGTVIVFMAILIWIIGSNT